MLDKQQTPLTGLDQAQARLKAAAWRIFGFGVLGLLYFLIVAEGLRMMIGGALTMPLRKAPIPGVSILSQFKETRKFDLACVFALVLMIVIFLLWETNIRLLCGQKSTDEKDLSHSDAYRAIVMTLSVVMLGCDAIMFYSGLVSQGDGPLTSGGGNAFAAFIATVLYLGLIITVSLVSVRLDARAGK